jgi:hypothetical protein
MSSSFKSLDLDHYTSYAEYRFIVRLSSYSSEWVPLLGPMIDQASELELEISTF